MKLCIVHYPIHIRSFSDASKRLMGYLNVGIHWLNEMNHNNNNRAEPRVCNNNNIPKRTFLSGDFLECLNCYMKKVEHVEGAPGPWTERWEYFRWFLGSLHWLHQQCWKLRCIPNALQSHVLPISSPLDQTKDEMWNLAQNSFRKSLFVIKCNDIMRENASHSHALFNAWIEMDFHS